MCISHFVFFFLPMTYYLLFILYIFKTMEMLLDKKQTRAIFLFEFKMGPKAAKKTLNMSNAFGPRTASECTVQWGFKRFCKGDESWRWGVQWLAIGSWQWPNERIIEADLITTWKIAKEPKVGHSTVICHLKQIGKVKKLDKGVSLEITENQKFLILKCGLLSLYATTMNHFTMGL